MADCRRTRGISRIEQDEFDLGSLAEGVVVQRATYRVLSIDAGVKYRGFFLATRIRS